MTELPPSPSADRLPPPVAIVTLLVGLMIAGTAVFLGDFAVKQKHAAVRRGWNMKPVMVAAGTLSAGTTLRREDVVPRDVPEQFATASLFTDVRALEGKTLFLPISKGTPFNAGFLDATRAACAGAPP